MADVGADLDVVEISLADACRNPEPPAVPRHVVLRMVLVDIQRQLLHAHGVVVTAHHGDAGDVMAVALDEGVDGIGVQRQADVLPQIVAVATGTAAGTVGDVDGQRDLVGYFLKNNSSVDVLQHVS